MKLDASAILTCHPSTPCAAVHQFAVRVWREGGKLALQYRLEGDINVLEIPPTAPAQRADGLWQTTCCELFIKGSLQTDSDFKTESVCVIACHCHLSDNPIPCLCWACYSLYR